MYKRGGMESQIPGGKPGILPFVRHGNNIPAGQVLPVFITLEVADRRRFIGLPIEPFINIEIIKLLGPEQPACCTSKEGFVRGR